ncbi:hypothetical protein GCM10022251_48370 [Phytohabitans flavus]|uniref:Uncharacterized protein n=1 Tax=Phytohabitans flavus TaxID=1076124 RepID=A0A6F8XSW4_9ACTN|nr:hypothetical protein Pflav_033200 [Phytohabitans flavus]
MSPRADYAPGRTRLRGTRSSARRRPQVAQQPRDGGEGGRPGLGLGAAGRDPLGEGDADRTAAVAAVDDDGPVCGAAAQESVPDAEKPKTG